VPAKGDPIVIPTPAPPRYPATVRTAGILWIVMGASVLTNLLLVIVFKIGLVTFAGTGSADAAVIGSVLGGLFQGVVGGIFLYEGIESCRGTIPSSVGLAVGSFLAAIIFGGIAIGQPALWPKSVCVAMALPALGFFVAGVLALRGRAQYEAWWKDRSRQHAARGGTEV